MGLKLFHTKIISSRSQGKKCVLAVYVRPRTVMPYAVLI